MTLSEVVPPGVPFVLRGLMVLSIPPFALLSAYKLLSSFFTFALPLWALVLACLFSIPAALAIFVWIRDWKQARDAAARGAILPPSWQGKLPANLDIMAKLAGATKTGYPGMNVSLLGAR